MYLDFAMFYYAFEMYVARIYSATAIRYSILGMCLSTLQPLSHLRFGQNWQIENQ